MISNIRWAPLVFWATLFLMVIGNLPLTALAHDGGPRLILNAGQVEPGESLQVRGANLGSDLVVRVEVAADGKAIPLGEVMCDGHGDFDHTFVLPKDLPTGTYQLQVIDPSVAGAEVVLASTPLRISTSGWPGLVGSTAVVAIVGFTLIGALLVLGLALRKRQRSALDTPKQRQVTQ